MKWGGYVEIGIIQLNVHKRELTVVIHVFIDVIFRREDLAHRSQKRLQHKINLLSVVPGRERQATGISVSLIICSTACFITKKAARHVTNAKKKAKQAWTNMNLSSSLKIRVTVFGATCSQAKLAPDVPPPLFGSLSKWKQSQWSKPAVRETRGWTRRGNE